MDSSPAATSGLTELGQRSEDEEVPVAEGDGSLCTTGADAVGSSPDKEVLQLLEDGVLDDRVDDQDESRSNTPPEGTEKDDEDWTIAWSLKNSPDAILRNNALRTLEETKLLYLSLVVGGHGADGLLSLDNPDRVADHRGRRA